MRLLVPGGEDTLHYAKPRLQALFARMHLLPDRAAGVSLKCEVRGIRAGHGCERSHIYQVRWNRSSVRPHPTVRLHFFSQTFLTDWGPQQQLPVSINFTGVQ